MCPWHLTVTTPPKQDLQINSQSKGRGGQCVRLLRSAYPSSNPTEVYNFSVTLLFDRKKKTKKVRGG